ncbi:MAG: TolC family protein [Gammaproteobacteria bacterium]|nr:TolC family protein [Gammaproteobacteria bacterium]
MKRSRLSTARRRVPLLILIAFSPGLVAQEEGPLTDEENAPIVIEASLTLAAAVEAALARAPGAGLLAAQFEAATNFQRRSRSFIAGAPSVQLRHLSDRLQTRQGVTESEAGIDLPLWRWGQRDAAANQATANQASAVEDAHLHRWQVAGAVRESYWGVREAQERLELARRDVAAFVQLERDVLRRIAAGDTAPAERLTAEGQRREREAALHEAEVVLADRFFGWRALTGFKVVPGASAERPAPAAATYVPLDAARTAATRADSALATLKAEGAGTPRLLLGVRHDTQNGAPDVDSLAAQLSVPFGGDSHRQVVLTPLMLDAARAHDQVSQMERESELMRHEAEHELHARDVALAGATRRVSLAMDELALARRSYTLGEIGLAERLLTEIRVAEANRTHRLAVIAYSRAIARFNQINGVLP